MGNKRLLIIAIFIAIFTAIVAYLWLKEEQRKAKVAQIPKVKVLVAAKQIPARTIVEKDMITYEEIPESPLTTKIAQKEEEVLGKVTTSAITQGEVLYKEKFQEKGAQAGLSFIVPPGKRAITIQVNNVTGVAGLLKPGDFVDVISTFEVPQTQVEGEQKPPVSMSITSLQNAQILALDTLTEALPSPPPSPATAQQPSPPPSYTLVTLAISPQDAEKITLLAEKSVNRLALRSVKDNAIYFSSGVKLDEITGIRKIEKPKQISLQKRTKTTKIPQDISSLPLPTLPSVPLSPVQEITPKKQIDVIRGIQVERIPIKEEAKK